MAALKYWLWLTSLRDVTNQQKLSLLEHFGEPEGIYYGEPEEYALTEGINRQAIRALENKSLDEVNRIMGDCQRLGLRIITMQDTEYPDRLRNIYDPPILLYVKGRMPQFDDEVAIAMVGSRKSSLYALEAGEKLAFQLAARGAIVVSGLAAGGDSAAHRGALRAGGTTVAVIGGGHDVIYPRENAYLYEDLAIRGAILSEYPPGTPHAGSHFPVRNRIISGLSLATVVIEAPEKSGTLITAGRALDQGRDVFALPGKFGDRDCLGSNRLIRDGAGIVTDVWDILSHYVAQYPHKIHALQMDEPLFFGKGREAQTAAEKAEQESEPQVNQEPALPVLDLEGQNGLTDDQIRIVQALVGRTLHVDDIIEETQIPTRRVLSALTMLEIDEIVTQESGKRFSLAVTLA